MKPTDPNLMEDRAIAAPIMYLVLGVRLSGILICNNFIVCVFKIIKTTEDFEISRR